MNGFISKMTLIQEPFGTKAWTIH